jgi:FKBP-type peptidyl-prolyl cis-trans isomerase
VKFHYQTRKCDGSNTVLDDSKKVEKPMELVLGKKFKFEVWEVIVQKMSLHEVAKFTVDKSVSEIYNHEPHLLTVPVPPSWSSTTHLWRKRFETRAKRPKIVATAVE